VPYANKYSRHHPGEILKVFPLKSETRQRCLLAQSLFSQWRFQQVQSEKEKKKKKKGGGKKERNGNYLNFVWYILYRLYVNKAVKKTFCLDPGLT